MQDFFSYYILCQQTILADVTVGCQSNCRRVSSIFDLLAPAATAAPAEPPTPASPSRLCCRAGVSTHYYSHRWPGHPSTHPHPMLFCGDSSRTSEPSYSSSHGHPLLRLPRLRVVPFLGLAVVHRRGALGAAWSMWSTTDFHQKSTMCGDADSWVHGRSKEVPPYYVQNNYSST